MLIKERNVLLSNAEYSALVRLTQKIASLNKAAGEIGPGMLNTIVDMAQGCLDILDDVAGNANATSALAPDHIGNLCVAERSTLNSSIEQLVQLTGITNALYDELNCRNAEHPIPSQRSSDAHGILVCALLNYIITTRELNRNLRALICRSDVPTAIDSASSEDEVHRA